jgi:hypothetical protein
VLKHTLAHVLADARAGAQGNGGGGALPAVGSADSLRMGGSEVRRRAYRRLVSNASVSEDTSFFESVSRTPAAHADAKGARPCVANVRWYIYPANAQQLTQLSPDDVDEAGQLKPVRACRARSWRISRGARVASAWPPF